MRGLYLLGASLLALAMAPAGAAAEPLCTDTWTGGGSGSWQTAGNWSGGHTPTISDVACIGAEATVSVTEGTAHAGVLSDKGSLVIGGGSLALEDALEASSVHALTISGGTLTGAATLDISSSFVSDFESTMSGSGSTVLLAGATGEFEKGIGARNLIGRSFVNEGTFKLAAGSITASEGALIKNTGTFSVDEERPLRVEAGGAAPRFLNEGTFQKAEGEGEAATTKVEVAFENEGAISAKKGALGFYSGGSSSGPGSKWLASAGARVVFASGSYSLGGGSIADSIEVNGASVSATSVEGKSAQVTLASGSLSVPSGSMTVDGLTMAGGTLGGAGTINVSGLLWWEFESTMAGTGKTVLLPGSTGTFNQVFHANLVERELINEGSVTLAPGGMHLSEGAEIKNVGTFTANSESGILALAGGTAPRFLNTGTLQKTSSSEATNTAIALSLENQGTVDAQKGNFQLTSGGTSNTEAKLVAAAGSTISLDTGAYTLTGSSITGAFNVAGASAAVKGLSSEKAHLGLLSGTLTVESGTTLVESFLISGGELTGSGTLDVSGSFVSNFESVMSGTGSTVLLHGSVGEFESGIGTRKLIGRSLVNEGTLTLNSGKLEESEGAVFRNTGTVDDNLEFGSEQLYAESGGAAPIFINAGTLEKTTGTGKTEVEVNFENQGVIRELSGSIKFLHPVVSEPTTQYGDPAENLSADPGQQHSCEGDPVSCATGNFLETQTDLAVGGRGLGLYLTRTYNSQAAAEGAHSAFGYGWTSSYSDHLLVEKTAKKSTLYQSDGSTVTFAEGIGGSFTAPASSQDTLTGSSEAGYTLTLANQTKYKFAGSSGRLESVTDRDGNATMLAYNGEGRLESITDPVGRKITLAYNGEGLVENVKDPLGHTVKYTYEGGNLKTVTQPAESSLRWQFKYDGSHEITEMTDGRGGKTINEYNGSHQVVGQKDPAGRARSFKYELFHTTITNETTGSVTSEYFSSGDEPVSVTHGYGTPSASTEAFAYNGAGQLLAATDGNGHTTEYRYDSAGDRTSTIDPDKDETKWTYDSTHDVETTTTPKGETTTIKRESHGNPEVVERPAPGSKTQITKYQYTAHGELESLTNPLERTWSYEYDAKGDRTSETDPEGNKRTWEYNEDSQETATVSPRGNVLGGKPAEFTTKVERDAQGRPLTVTEPLSEGIYDFQFGSSGTGAGQFATPISMAIDPSGNLWVVDNANNRIQKFSPAGAFIETIGFGVSNGEAKYEICTSSCRAGTAGSGSGQFQGPRGIAINQSTGNIYVTDSGNSRVEELSSTATFVRAFGSPGSGHGDLASPNGLAIDSAGNLWVADTQNNRIEEFSESGGYESTFGSEGSGNGQLKTPNDVAISGGKLYVADFANNRIEVFSPTTGEYLSQFGGLGSGNGQLSSPGRIATDPADGDLYVADHGNNRIQVFSPAGAYLAKFASLGKGEGQVENLKALAIGLTGTVFTSDAGNERVEAWTAPVPRITKYAYDADGNLETLTDANNRTTTYTYNADNQPIKVKEPNGTVTETEYDGAGQVTGQTDGNKHKTKYVRNALEQVTEITDPLGRKTTKEYDGAGELKTLTDAAKRTTTYTSHPANRLTEVSYSDGKTPTVKYEYNADGERTKTIDGTGTSTYGYDQLDRMTESKDGHGDVAKYEYDLADNQTKITYPNGKSVSRAYDKDDRLEKVTDWLEHATSFAYDPDSDLSKTTFPAGTSDVDAYAYNDAAQMTEDKMTKSTETLASLVYTRDDNGQLRGATSKGLPGPEATEDAYDEDNRLTKSSGTEYKYDSANNPTKTGASTNTYDEADELETSTGLTYSYDELGERTKQTPSTGPATTYGYDQADNLTTVERPKEGEVAKIEDAYAYNGEGLRASQTISGTTSYLAWDTAASLPVILTDGTNSYIYGPGNMPVEQISSGGTVTYLHHDQAGSTRLLTGSTGTVTGKCTYGAYGTPTCEGATTTPLGFDAQYTSSDTGLIYMRARVYDPATAQFLSVDPLVGQTHAPYNYAGDNPLNEADPTGLGNWLNLGLPSPGEVAETLNPVKYYEEEIESYENGCGYFSSVAHGLEGAVVGALDVSGEGEEAELADGADEAGDELAATPEGRPYSAHYLNDTGPVRNIPGSVVDETITQATDSTNLGDRTVYYDAKNDVTVVQSNTTGKIMSVRKGEP